MAQSSVDTHTHTCVCMCMHVCVSVCIPWLLEAVWEEEAHSVKVLSHCLKLWYELWQPEHTKTDGVLVGRLRVEMVTLTGNPARLPGG